MFPLVFYRSTFYPEEFAHYYNNESIRPDLFVKFQCLYISSYEKQPDKTPVK